MKCPGCGCDFNGNETRCEYCGTPLNQSQSQNQYNNYSNNQYQDNNMNNQYQNNMNNQYYNNGYNPQYNMNNQMGGANKKKLIIIITGVVVLIAAIILIVCLTSGGSESSSTKKNNNHNNNNNNSYSNDNNYDKVDFDKDYSSDVEYEYFELNGDLWVKVINNSNKNLNVEVKTNFYDENEKPLGDDSVYAFCLEKGVEYYSKVYIDFEYDSYKTSVEANETLSELIPFDQFKLVGNTKDDWVYIDATNNSKTKASYLTILVKFYKDGKMIAMATDYEYDVEPGDTAHYSIFVPTTENYEHIIFDDYKYEVIEAFIFDYDK